MEEPMDLLCSRISQTNSTEVPRVVKFTENRKVMFGEVDRTFKEDNFSLGNENVLSATD